MVEKKHFTVSWYADGEEHAVCFADIAGAAFFAGTVCRGCITGSTPITEAEFETARTVLQPHSTSEAVH